MTLTFNFRFPIEQTGPNSIELKPPANSQSLIDSETADRINLSAGERIKANDAALRAIAILE